ncbi:MAG: hypothetical protein ACPG4U_07015 [Pseudomonadales bacterium]
MRILMGIVGGFLLAACLWWLLFAGQVGHHTPSSQWVREAYQFKNKLSAEIDAPKIALVAGSNVMFGINSQMLSDYYQQPVINQGVNAGIGLEFIINQGKRILRPGDIALLPIEYALFNYHGNTNSVMADYYVSEGDLFYQQSLKLQFNILKNIGLKRIYEGYRGIPEGFKVAGLYGAHNMNAQGDQINSQKTQRSAGQANALLNHQPSRDGEDFSAANSSWDFLKAFQEYAQANDICLLYIPPTMMYNEGYHSIESERRYYEGIPGMAREQGLTYLGDPFDYMYAPDHYFDTNFHLVSESRDMHTKNIIQLLGPDLSAHCVK